METKVQIRHHNWAAIFAAAALAGLVGSRSDAAFESFTSFGPFQSRLNALDYDQRENLLFNDPGLNLGPAVTVQGQTNQTDFRFNITNTDTVPINLVAGGGQATISGQGGANFTSVRFEPVLPDVGFLAFAFDVDFASQSIVGGSMMVRLYGLDGNLLDTVSFSNPTDGFYGVISVSPPSPPSVIRAFEIVSSLANNIEQVEQVRIVNAASFSAVPEPSSIAMVGMAGMAGLGILVRRRKS